MHSMGCNMKPSSGPPVISKLTTKTPTILFSSSSLNSQKLQNHHHVTISCASSQSSNTNTQVQLSNASVYNLKFNTLKGCKLGISIYPDFVYDAEGGVGTGSGTKVVEANQEEVSVTFDLQTLYIPPLNSKTTRFLGLPLPPLLKIDISPQLFGGTIDKESGKVNLKFKAEFLFSVGTIYKAPPLLVETVLTSEESIGEMRRGRGQRLDSEGKCKLVGVASVDPIDDFFMNTFLGLPTECLAELNATVFLTAAV